MALKIDETLIRDDNGEIKVGKADDMEISAEESARVALYDNFKEVNSIEPRLYTTTDVKRGLRNADGTGVVAGMTKISSVNGYELIDGKKHAIEGSLRFRGHELRELIGDDKDRRFNYEEVAHLLLMGNVPSKEELERFVEIIDAQRELPDGFTASMIMNTSAPDIMNVLARSILSLYSYDEHAEERTPSHEIHTAISLISRLPRVMVLSYYNKRAKFYHESMIMHRFIEGQSTSETILSMLRPDRSFTPEEARLLDVMLCIHAEHGGGNNSTFTTRVLSSTDTDPYSAYAAAIGSLKGYRHGGANHKIRAMQAEMKSNISRDKWSDDGAVSDYLRKILRKEAYDRTGLIYGMGHAVYTLSDPRAIILKEYASQMAEDSKFEDEYKMLETIERVAPIVAAEERGISKELCANVDMYSGFVYEMMGIPEDLYTPLFACARMAGWAAHRFEEIVSGKRIIRPAYANAIEAGEKLAASDPDE